jgi:hypothetical protein
MFWIHMEVLSDGTAAKVKIKGIWVGSTKHIDERSRNALLLLSMLRSFELFFTRCSRIPASYSLGSCWSFLKTLLLESPGDLVLGSHTSNLVDENVGLLLENVRNIHLGNNAIVGFEPVFTAPDVGKIVPRVTASSLMNEYSR